VGTPRFSAQRSLFGSLPLRGRVGVGAVGTSTVPIPHALPQAPSRREGGYLTRLRRKGLSRGADQTSPSGRMGCLGWGGHTSILHTPSGSVLYFAPRLNRRMAAEEVFVSHRGRSPARRQRGSERPPAPPLPGTHLRVFAPSREKAVQRIMGSFSDAVLCVLCASVVKSSSRPLP